MRLRLETAAEQTMGRTLCAEGSVSEMVHLSKGGGPGQQCSCRHPDKDTEVGGQPQSQPLSLSGVAKALALCYWK